MCYKLCVINSISYHSLCLCMFPLPSSLISTNSRLNSTVPPPVRYQIVDSALQSVANPTAVFALTVWFALLVFVLLSQDLLLTSSGLSLPVPLPFIWLTSTTACPIFSHSVHYSAFLCSLQDTSSWTNAIYLSTTWANDNKSSSSSAYNSVSHKWAFSEFHSM